MSKKDKLSIIVPCYNEEESVPLFYKETVKVLEGMEGIDYEFVFIDDGSTDHTLHIVKELSQRDEHCRYASFSRNFGKEAGMYAGLKEAEGDYCVIMDADLQHPPALLPKMYQAVSREDYDCCGGKRCGREGDGAFRSLCSGIFYKVSKKLTHMDMSDGYGDFRMMARPMVDAVLEMKEYNRYMKGIFSFVGFRTKWIEFHNVERNCGSSKWGFRSLLAYAEEGILAFSTLPLKMAGPVGILLLFGAILYFFGNLLQCLWVPQSLGSYDILLIVILLLGGLQMIFLHILGAYISKDYMENKNRPLYIIKEKG